MDTFNVIPKPKDGDWDRFMSFVKIDQDGCWVWIGGSRGKGDYGAFWFHGVQRAHRVSYVWTYGDPGPVEIHHKCNVPRCVNPLHLELATSEQPHHRGQFLNFCAHGHEFTSENTYLDGEGHRQCRQCSRDKSSRYYEKNRESISAKRSRNRPRVVYEPRPCPKCGKEYTPIRSTSTQCPDCRKRPTDYQREYMRTYRAAKRAKG